MLKTLFCLFYLIVFAVVGSAQVATVLKESGIKKLDVLTGTWKARGNPDGSGNTPVSALTTCQWSANGAYLVCDQLVTNNGARTNNLSIYAYNADKDAYTLSLVGVPGMDPFSIGVTYKGDTLFYNSEYTANGKKVYARTLNVFASPSAYAYIVQSSDDGLNWQTSASGQSERVQHP
jgi:hypothetical protein